MPTPRDSPAGPLELAGDQVIVYRIGYQPDPFAWTPWQYADNGRFDGRWDDPDGTYRTLYVGARLLGCLLEVLADFRPDRQRAERLLDSVAVDSEIVREFEVRLCVSDFEVRLCVSDFEGAWDVAQLVDVERLRISETFGAHVEALGSERGHHTLIVLQKPAPTWTHIRYPRGMATTGPSTQHAIRAWAASLLQQARLRSGFSQRELALAADVPRSTIARIETGQMQPTLPTLQKILVAAGWEMRIRLEPYDSHDDVLDALAADDPGRAKRAKAGADALAARLRSAS